MTPNVIPERKPIRRPRKPRNESVPVDTARTKNPDENPDDHLDPDNRAINAPTATTTFPASQAQSFLRVEIPKRSRDNESEDEEDGHRDKISRAHLALIILDVDDVNVDDMLDDDLNSAWAYFGGDGRRPKAPIPEPATYDEAINNLEWGELWKEAIRNELEALIANQTWIEIVPPKSANIVTSKWVFKVKMNIDGTLDKFKARLVARGFSQVYGVDYQETFAPTVKFDTLRLFLALVAAEDLECHQVDVNNAFTESMLKEDIYMSPPSGLSLAPGRALHIVRSLYGLKQAARDWHKKCVGVLLKLGFRQCAADPCLLVNDKRKITLLVYVNDLGIAAKSINAV